MASGYSTVVDLDVHAVQYTINTSTQHFTQHYAYVEMVAYPYRTVCLAVRPRVGAVRKKKHKYRKTTSRTLHQRSFDRQSKPDSARTPWDPSHYATNCTALTALQNCRGADISAKIKIQGLHHHRHTTQYVLWHRHTGIVNRHPTVAYRMNIRTNSRFRFAKAGHVRKTPSKDPPDFLKGASNTTSYQVHVKLQGGALL